MSGYDRLRALANALPPRGAILLTREDILTLLDGAGDVEDSSTRDLTVGEVATEMHRAPSTVRGWLIAGALKGYKFRGKAWRVPRSALRAFLDAEAAPPPTDPDNVDVGAWRREPRP